MAVCADCGTVVPASDLVRVPLGASGAEVSCCLDCLMEQMAVWFAGKAGLRWQFLRDFATVSV